MEIFPTEITANRHNSSLAIAWSDGHSSIYSFALLRAACPCASCRGGHENMSSEPDVKVFSLNLPEGPSIKMRNLEAAGSYGLIFEWEDEHHFGIYTWHYLRALCPCNLCRQQEN
jgi:DUF971 family protein